MEDFATASTHAVGQKLPNPWGPHDVHDPNYYARSPAVDPKGPTTGTARVVRGGSWHETSNSWRSAFRKPYEPDYRSISIGFRLVRTAD